MSGLPGRPDTTVKKLVLADPRGFLQRVVISSCYAGRLLLRWANPLTSFSLNLLSLHVLSNVLHAPLSLNLPAHMCAVTCKMP